MKYPQFAFYNGQIIPYAQANVSIGSTIFNYGSGCFDGIRGYWNREQNQLYMFQLDEHYRRLRSSARILKINVAFTPEELSSATLELVKREGYQEDVYVRPVAFKNSSQIGGRLDELEDALSFFVVPMGDHPSLISGITVAVSSWKRIQDSAIPARCKINGTYVNSLLARTEAQERGFHDAIFLTREDKVSELTGANIFLVRDGILITPSPTEDILEGITRRVVIELAVEELGLQVVERRVDRTELYIADEVFACGTGAQVQPIIQVDGNKVGNGSPGEITRRMQDLFLKVVRGKVGKYAGWCTPVYQAQPR